MMRPLWRQREHAWQVYVPLPFPLRWVNAYVLRDDEGFTVIDPGLHTEQAEQAWIQVMQEIGFGFGDVRQIVLTHHHPDHYGLAGWFKLQSGCEVQMSADAWREAERMWGDDEKMTDRVLAQFSSHGMDAETIRQVKHHLKSFVPLVSPQPKPEDIKPIPIQSSIVLGGREFETIPTPGHAFGHICLYDRKRRVMFCGDHVLPQISPNVSLLPDGDSNPLQSYLDSLHKVESYEVDHAYPGHRDPFASFGARVKELQKHHEDRLEEMRLRMDRRSTAYALCRRIFGDRLSIHQLRFAMAETLAHLRLLEYRGLLTQSTDDDGIHYFAR